jgi:ketosteroid isomerase-like protein
VCWRVKYVLNQRLIQSSPKVIMNKPDNKSHHLTKTFDLIRAAYVAFNARDIDGALMLMTPDVAWPRAFKGGFVHGHQQVREYWTEQWSEINPSVDPISFQLQDSDRIAIDVQQVVRDLSGNILATDGVRHRFTIRDGLIEKMEVLPLPLYTTSGFC